MAEYFGSREDAESFIKKYYPEDERPPVHFAKILNHGEVKWIVNYDARQSPWASPHIQLLEDHSKEIAGMIAAFKPPAPFVRPPRSSGASREPLDERPAVSEADSQAADYWDKKAYHAIFKGFALEREYYTKALERDPNREYVWRRFAQAAEEAGDVNLAKKCRYAQKLLNDGKFIGDCRDILD